MATTPILTIIEKVRPDLTREAQEMWDKGETAGAISRWFTGKGVDITDEAVRRWFTRDVGED